MQSYASMHGRGVAGVGGRSCSDPKGEVAVTRREKYALTDKCVLTDKQMLTDKYVLTDKFMLTDKCVLTDKCM